MSLIINDILYGLVLGLGISVFLVLGYYLAPVIKEEIDKYWTKFS